MADLLTVFEVLVFLIIMALVFSSMNGRIKKAREKAYSELEPLFKEFGFSKPPQPKMSGPEQWLAKTLGTGSNALAGEYRGRRFELAFFVPGGLTQDIAISIKSPNRTGKTISFRFTDSGKMEENSLSDIHRRLDALGLYGVLWKDSGFGQWNLFGVYKDEVRYILPGTLLTKASFIESLDIICDTMDRLGV